MHSKIPYEEVRFWCELIDSYEQRQGEDAPPRMYEALKLAIEKAIEQRESPSHRPIQ